MYEEESGQLAGLSAALRRGGRTRCHDCGQLGATTSCLCEGCHTVVHFACALRRRRTATSAPLFTADRSFLCSRDCYAAMRRQRYRDLIRDLRMRKRTTQEQEHQAEEESIDKDERDIVSLIAAGIITQKEAEGLARQIDADMDVGFPFFFNSCYCSLWLTCLFL